MLRDFSSYLLFSRYNIILYFLPITGGFVPDMTRENMFVDAQREEWMTPELEELLKRASKDGKVTCAVAQQFARDHNIPMNRMKAFLDVLELKVSGCQLGCF